MAGPQRKAGPAAALPAFHRGTGRACSRPILDRPAAAPTSFLAALIEDFQKRGGTIWACPPSVKTRGYEQADLVDGVIIAGASVMHAEIKTGAATLSF